MNPESTLNQLKTTLPNGQLPSSFGVYYKNTLVALCHALEDHILQTSSPEPNQQPLVLVTFQEGKWYLQEAERYFDIGQCCRHVAIAALPDSGFINHRTGKLDNVSLINLDPTDDLVWEWNLIILAPGYTAMVLCYELSDEEYLPHGIPTTDTERKFYGLWTFDSNSVRQAAEILIQRIHPYNPDLANRLQQQHQEIIATPSTSVSDLSGVVSRIVTYLQTSQQELIAVNRQTRELRELEDKAKRVSRNINANKLQAFLRMVQRVDQRDKDNPCASLQVSALCETLGQLLDLPTLKLRRLRLAGLLYRIGLASAPPEVFTQTPEEMDDSTRAFWQERGVIGARLLEAMPELAIVKDIVAHHLEHWDGSGKPDGQKGEEINIKARILGLVSYFQELTQPRGNRPALSLSEALEKCQQLSGTRFDPELVESLTTVVRLSEIGLMQLPQLPTQLPNVWLEDNSPSHQIRSNS
ncbi:MAG: HD domain-containing phosphohydrolase [Limnoraphis robusta]|uniref:HD domain-containing phosphohydrolase n=1 Tax=Limnoraphis robusta CCNP1315 TaxID=3110306 RepID=A0ABU5TXY9_9CYAN|nr:HD domain-containing phosphohydrolase [Limnoraphis robusta]MEA5519812.1 HD domain-containing phosphohydrolase [Limnoraphis robusta CCNP1315]MEA5548147.1 HD domain-containing phosphohydrolase [Limnoraphis robusta CCNP1324]